MLLRRGPVVILWENRLLNDRGNDATASVDCLDCPFQQVLIEKDGKWILNKALYCYKFRDPGLHYELAFSLMSNDIVSINGPFAPGDWNDIDIFCNSLMLKVEEGERIEADNGYIGEAPRHVICPASVELLAMANSERLKFNKRIQGRHEVVNKHLKHWSCLKKPFTARGTSAD
mmetsp:Transcript_10731/g.16451  ORF Transcript_10731/g.16451 Transcript_10731/m.16451 type:complete len:174 (-) Transcript_10731:157-678(-)